MSLPQEEGVLLLLDSCGEQASVAVVGQGGAVLAERTLAPREAAAGLLPAVREALTLAEISLLDLAGLGVVNGPGSFTGVRVGLAVVKGLVLASGVPVVAVSRLEVLAGNNVAAPAAAISAGRGQVYLRLPAAHGAAELLVEDGAVAALVAAAELVVDSKVLQDRLQGVRPVRLRHITAYDAQELVRAALHRGSTAPELIDANYVRDETAIYRRRSEARPA